MNLLRLKRELRSYMDANVPVQLISAPGLGKSETVDQAVKDFSRQDNAEWGIATVLAAAYTPPDVFGYLVPTDRVIERADGTTETVKTSEFTMPPWMISDDGRPMNSFKRGIVFFDEWDKVEPDTKKALANVLLNGAAGRHRTHRGIGFVTAANRAEDRSGSTKEFDFIINRRAELHIRPDVGSWEDWAVRNDVPPTFTAFAVRRPEIVFSGRVPDKQGPYCTPRSLVKSSQLCVAGGHLDTQTGNFVGLGDEDAETTLNEKLSGLMGPEATNELLIWARLKTEVPEFVEIVADPSKAKIPTKMDAKMLVAYDCAHRIDVANANKVVEYMLRMGAEHQMVFGVASVKRNFRLLQTKAFVNDFIPRNQGIISLVGMN